MEKRSRLCDATVGTTLLIALIFNFVLCVHCQEWIAKHISSDTPSPSTAPEFKDRFQRIVLSILFGVITGLIFASLFACLVRCLFRYINRTPILKGPVVFSPKIPPKTLQLALSNDTQLLGSSPIGKYYRAVLDNGLTVAVKRLEPLETNESLETTRTQSKSAKRRIQQELELLACLRHRNLMSLRAYVRESDRFSLIYDYMPGGSLEDAMNRVRQNQLQLSWEVRLRVAVGIIKGLQYLHFTCSPRVLHYNLKPTNVLLDAEFEPRLADCGLAKLTLLTNSDTAASCYRARECFQNFRYTDKSDVFSFGMILGELLTGREPMDPSFGEAGSLGRWLRHQQEAGEAREAIDKTIMGEEMEEDEMLMAVKISVVCLSDLPADRPSSDELVSMLTQLNSF